MARVWEQVMALAVEKVRAMESIQALVMVQARVMVLERNQALALVNA